MEFDNNQDEEIFEATGVSGDNVSMFAEVCSEDYQVPGINNCQNEKVLPLDESLQKKIEELQPGFGTTGKTVVVMIIDDKETDESLKVQGGYIRDGTLRQSHEIQMLKDKMQQLEKLNTKLTKKNKSLKVKLDHCNNVHKNLHRKQKLAAKMEKIPFLKTLLSRMENSKSAWPPECLKLATQIRFAGNKLKINFVKWY